MYSPTWIGAGTAMDDGSKAMPALSDDEIKSKIAAGECLAPLYCPSYRAAPIHAATN